tara:strand:+ start:550 stop:1107 length:558 start_codon:yes stop_codon:yes gene_type:complete
MAFSPLANVVDQLKNFGFFDVVLPMLLIFLILYAILRRTEILGDPEKGFVRAINALVSLVVAFLFITETSLVARMNEMLPRAAFLLVVTAFILILLAFVGVYKKDVFSDMNWTNWLIAVPLILIFLGILDASGIRIPIIHGIMVFFAGGPGVSLSITKETLNIGIAVIVCAAVLGLIIYIVSSKD